jgi:hypothetical protein
VARRASRAVAARSAKPRPSASNTDLPERSTVTHLGARCSTPACIEVERRREREGRFFAKLSGMALIVIVEENEM